ncbi:hypothetical protein N7471_013931 [Penicillium samsonianum]|uniref:uncharacterized protein n=1 Tax=Penicillium samsonianum TaxID=1882272 RepID=UPI002546CC74|nr:uncharacterized protein N7471_013931 [Penicillium samsonianum]KAJ6118054.1 hypothetical protein N7471_013931 [Penicillium samsonianum]
MPSSTHEIRVVLQKLEWAACQAGQKLKCPIGEAPRSAGRSLAQVFWESGPTRGLALSWAKASSRSTTLIPHPAGSRALVFLETPSWLDVTQLEIHEVLAANIIGDLINTVEKQLAKEALGAAPVVVHEPKPDSSFIPARPGAAVIPTDDAEEVFDLPVNAKLRYFDYHCRVQCLVALGVDPEYYDTIMYVGGPRVALFVCKIPQDIDPARLQCTVDTVLPRYDCFRTVIVPVEHPITPFAVICDDTDTEYRNSLWSHTINGIQTAAEASISVDKPSLTVAWVSSPNRVRCAIIRAIFHSVYNGTRINFRIWAVLAEYAKPGSAPPIDLLPIRTAVELNLGYD